MGFPCNQGLRYKKRAAPSTSQLFLCAHIDAFFTTLKHQSWRFFVSNITLKEIKVMSQNNNTDNHRSTQEKIQNIPLDSNGFCEDHLKTEALFFHPHL